MTNSEPPFDRLGDAVDREKEPRTVPLHGGRRESVFSLAHRHLGEWRRWREIVEENKLADPLDLMGRSVESDPSFVTEEDEDVTEDTGVGLTVVNASPGLMGPSVLHIEDIEEGVFEIYWTAPADDEPGAAVVVKEGDFFDDDGHPVDMRIQLPSERDEHFLYIEMDADSLMVLWMMRDVTVWLDATRERTELRIPRRRLEAARGEQ